MKTAFYTLLNMAWTVFYFGLWGGYYGAWLGFIIGTGAVPILGTMIGSFVGIWAGAATGCLIGAGIAVFHSLSFEADNNLEWYRRRLGGGVTMFILGLGLTGLVKLFLDHGIPSWSAVQCLYVLCIILSSLLMLALAMGYTAYHYPNEMVKRLARQQGLPLDEESIMLLKKQTASTQMEEFLTLIYPRWMYIIATLIGMGFGAAAMGLPGLALGGFLGCLGFFAFALFCAIGNGFLLVFLKAALLKSLFPDLSPHRYRTSLTLISFVFTLLTCWWTLIFAPILAFYIAYHVYHTLALPDDEIEKAKHKEKSAFDSIEGQALSS